MPASNNPMKLGIAPFSGLSRGMEWPRPMLSVLDTLRVRRGGNRLWVVYKPSEAGAACRRWEAKDGKRSKHRGDLWQRVKIGIDSTLRLMAIAKQDLDAENYDNVSTTSLWIRLQETN